MTQAPALTTGPAATPQGAPLRRLPGRGLRHLARSADRLTGTPDPERGRRRALEERGRVQERDLARQAERLAAATAELERYQLAYRRLVAAVRGIDEDTMPGHAGTPNRRWNRLATETRGEAALAAGLRAGLDLPAAVVATVRPLLRDRHVDARALCHALYARPESRVAGALGGALVAARQDLFDLAADLFAEVPADLVAQLAPAEYARVGVRVDDPEAVARAVRWLDDAAVTDAPTLVELAEVLFAADEHGPAVRALDAARAAGGLDEAGARRAALLRTWAARGAAPQEPAAVPAGRVSFGVIDYKQPDESTTSSNLGDYVQTIASLGHLVRHTGLTFHGDPELAQVVTELGERVRPELRVEGPGADVELTVVNRDASSLDAVPENTWAIAFGWYMQSAFGLRYDFPFHANVNPLFVSFHVNRPSMLTEDAVAYLTAHGPVGCRDWNTVFLLLNKGVPAFFSGCLTTTIDTVFPDRTTSAPPGSPTVYVDTAAPSPDDLTITQAREDVRWTPMVPNVREALGLLEEYRTSYGGIVTSRLHCYLPSWSIGAPVTFTPRNRADVRFAGLLDADEDGLRAMRERIRDLLAPSVGLLLSGAPADEVYAAWRAACAPEVARAKAAFERPAAELPLSFDVDAACRTARESRVVVPATTPRPGEPVHAAVALDANLKAQMEVVVQGMVAGTARPLHVVALTRDHTGADHDRLAALFPEVTFEWIACDDIDYGPVLGMLSHITVSTMDRLLLPELLPDVDRLVYHDIDALTLVDLATLHDVELDGAPLAARASVGHGVRSGLGNLLRSGRRLSASPGAANELFRTMYARHPGDFAAFNAGILVLDLARMRADEFTRRFVPFVEHYGLNDQEVLNCYAGSGYRRLDPAWNMWPSQETVREPRILHWAGHQKPWDAGRYVLERERWDEAGAAVEERRRVSRAG
ncbi:glycosyltransferase [Isoptericola sp. NPDC057653]|uniref:glycosyltransferase n=1 Tax=Isoptericola sp. NPDC057653 TaxID=3346195 RepID=UPI0036C8FE53